MQRKYKQTLHNDKLNFPQVIPIRITSNPGCLSVYASDEFPRLSHMYTQPIVASSGWLAV